MRQALGFCQGPERPRDVRVERQWEVHDTFLWGSRRFPYEGLLDHNLNLVTWTGATSAAVTLRLAW